MGCWVGRKPRIPELKERSHLHGRSKRGPTLIKPSPSYVPAAVARPSSRSSASDSSRAPPRRCRCRPAVGQTSAGAGFKNMTTAAITTGACRERRASGMAEPKSARPEAAAKPTSLTPPWAADSWIRTDETPLLAGFRVCGAAQIGAPPSRSPTVLNAVPNCVYFACCRGAGDGSKTRDRDLLDEGWRHACSGPDPPCIVQPIPS